MSAEKEAAEAAELRALPDVELLHLFKVIVAAPREEFSAKDRAELKMIDQEWARREKEGRRERDREQRKVRTVRRAVARELGRAEVIRKMKRRYRND
jgi:hypothetical protein